LTHAHILLLRLEICVDFKMISDVVGWKKMKTRGRDDLPPSSLKSLLQ
jgi:hypothetical protein